MSVADPTIRVTIVDLCGSGPVDIPQEGALVVVRSGRSVVGELRVPGNGADEWRRGRLLELLGRRGWEVLLRDAFFRATRGTPRRLTVFGRPTVSVVVEVAAPEPGLERTLDALSRLDPPPAEVLVVGADRQAARMCEDRGIRVVPQRPGILEAATGDLVAFIDGDAVPERAWLGGLEEVFGDRLMAAVVGYNGPEAGAWDAEWLQARTPGVVEGLTVDGAFSVSPVREVAAIPGGGNLVVRRAAAREVGGLGERGPGARPAHTSDELDLFYRLVDRGYRIVRDPSRVVWSTRRRSRTEARRHALDRCQGASAYAARSIATHREASGAAVWARALRSHLSDAIAASRSEREAKGWRTVFAEVRGTIRGPFSARRAGIPIPSGPGFAAPAQFAPKGLGGDISYQPTLSLSVVIPTYNRALLLREVLLALARQDYPPELFEVVVIVDGSTDGTADLVGALELPFRLRIIEQPNRGIGAARNRGLKEAANDAVVFVDDDIVPERAFLREHARVLESTDDRHVGIGYCPSATRGHGISVKAARAHWEDHFRRKADVDHAWSGLEFSVGNSSLRKAFLDRCGAFDGEFRRRNEEQEAGLRLVSAGARFSYLPDACGWHHHEADVRRMLQIHRLQAREDVLLARKYPLLIPRLTLAAYHRDTGRGMSLKASISFRYARVLDRLTPTVLRVASGCERARLRQTWWGLTGWLMANAYLGGLGQELDGLAGYRRLTAPLSGTAAHRLQVDLATSGSLRVPPVESAIDLSLVLAEETLASLPAREPGKEWSWDELCGRAVAESIRPAMSKLTPDRFLEAVT